MNTVYNACKIKPEDNVAVVLSDIASSAEVVVHCPFNESTEVLFAVGDIPIGHKIALNNLSVGERVFKYSFPIGVVTCNVQRGEHVHSHNMSGLRGRGDN